MHWIRRRALADELLSGTFLNLGSSITAELAARAGFDWLLFDLEHGAGDRQELLAQLQAISAFDVSPIVRLGGIDAITIKRILDIGAVGLMIPLVNTADDARRAIDAMLYPPEGQRGVAVSTRAAAFGGNFDEYFARANEELLVVVQIETRDALANLEDIASVDRVDVIFLGPLDLSVSLGDPKNFDSDEFREAAKRIARVAREHGKAAGVLALSPELASRYLDDGYTFVACGSDGGAAAAGLRSIADALAAHRDEGDS